MIPRMQPMKLADMITSNPEGLVRPNQVITNLNCGALTVSIKKSQT
jgi:hypothetical protein